jgi:hypothetical protein
MRLTLTQEEVENVVYCALCNGALTFFRGYDLSLDLNKSNYEKYRAEGQCFEDVLMAALRGGERLYFADDEGDEDASFSLQDAVEKLNGEHDFAKNILNIIEETDDANDGDVILQLCLYGDVVFG